MALIVYAEGQQRSGSLGGSVYSHNRYGQYIRARSIPVNPNTDRQVAARNATRNLAIAWSQTLTQDQRDAWDTYAANVSWVNKVGHSVNLTGEAHYIRSNAPRIVAGLARVDDAPSIFELAQAEAALAVAFSATTGDFTVTFDDTAPWCSEDDAAQLVQLGLPQQASIKYFGGPFRFAAALLGDSGAPLTSPQVVAQSTVGWTYSEGNRIWLRTRITRADGRLSEFAQTNFLGAA